MQCFLVVVTNDPLPDIPERFAKTYVKLSGDHSCIVADQSATTEEIAGLFGVTAGSGERRGLVAKLEHLSGSEGSEIVDKFKELQNL